MTLADLKKIIFLAEDCYNIYSHERRLIAIALIKTKFNLEQARKMNCPELLHDSYINKMRRLDMSVKELKKCCQDNNLI